MMRHYCLFGRGASGNITNFLQASCISLHKSTQTDSCLRQKCSRLLLLAQLLINNSCFILPHETLNCEYRNTSVMISKWATNEAISISGTTAATFSSFEKVSQLTVKECILNSAPKSCELDPIPSKLLIECLDSILPSLTDLFNSSLASGIFPQCFKSALVTPILKKRCLDHNDLNNYRPVSNLCFIAKILEKLVLSQVSSYLNFHNLYNTCQSAYRSGHSTETALLKVVNDLFLSLNKGNISVLALLDFSSAFDTIDHTILVHRLHTDFGFTDTVLQWFSSYLTDRTHYVSLCNHCSDFAPVHSGVPHGSVLGPMLFTMYIKPLSAIIDSHSIIHHSFPDDFQLQMSAPPDIISELLHSMQSRISDVKAWATVNMLKLNDSKTELMLVTSKRSKHLHNLSTSITIGNAQIPFKQSVKNLCLTLDCHLL